MNFLHTSIQRFIFLLCEFFSYIQDSVSFAISLTERNNCSFTARLNEIFSEFGAGRVNKRSSRLSTTLQSLSIPSLTLGEEIPFRWNESMAFLVPVRRRFMSMLGFYLENCMNRKLQYLVKKQSFSLYDYGFFFSSTS